MKIKFDCRAISDLAEAAEILTSAFGKYRVFAFYGEMGAGKTTFISAIVKELGSFDVVQSSLVEPAFVNDFWSAQSYLIYFEMSREVLILLFGLVW